MSGSGSSGSAAANGSGDAAAGGLSTLGKALIGGAVLAAGVGAYIAYSYKQYSNELEVQKHQKAKPKFKPSRSSKAGSSAGSSLSAAERLAAAASSGTALSRQSSGGAGSVDSKGKSKKSKRSKGDLKFAELAELPVTYKPKSSKTPSANDLVLKLAQSLQVIRQTKRISEADKQLMEFIRQIPVGEYASPKDRMLVAQFMILYYTLMSLTIANESEFTKMVSSQKADLPLTWNLLQLPTDAKDIGEEERRASDQFLLDIATRMQDGHRLSAVFDRVFARGIGAMSDQELIGAFAVSCVVGKWSRYRELGKKIIERRGSLLPFHQAALQQPTNPDFEQLHTMAESEAKARGDTALSDLRWQAYLVKSMRLKMKHAEANDKDMLSEIQNNFKSAESPEGKDVAVPDQRMIRTGAYVQMICPSMMPIPLIGPATNTRISLAGYIDLQANAKQVEEYAMTLASTNGKTSTWTGTYVMSTATGGGAAQKMKLVFDATMVLEEDDMELM